MKQNKDKKLKVMMHEDIMKDMEDIPEEVEQEINDLIKGFKDGTIDPETVGKPVDMEEMKREEPELYKLLMERYSNGRIT